MRASLPALFIALAASAPGALAQPAAARQDLTAVRQLAEQYLTAQSAGLKGEVTVSIGALDQRMLLAPCTALQAFQQPGARAWGKTSVGVRCTAPSAWTIYLQAQVSVKADYVATAVPLVQGQAIEEAQLVMVRGDLASLPNGVLTDKTQAVGRTSTVSLASGAPLRQDLLRSKPVVQQGQAVKVVNKGAGFSVSADAKAIGTAGEGQVVQVRTPGGAVLSGVARAGGIVEVF